MPLTILLSPESIADVDYGFEYYNSKSVGLGFEFTEIINIYLTKISEVPTAFAIRYDNVRVKPVNTFPYTIHFTIDENQQQYYYTQDIQHMARTILGQKIMSTPLPSLTP